MSAFVAFTVSQALAGRALVRARVDRGRRRGAAARISSGATVGFAPTINIKMNMIIMRVGFPAAASVGAARVAALLVRTFPPGPTSVRPDLATPDQRLHTHGARIGPAIGNQVVDNGVALLEVAAVACVQLPVD